MNPNPSIYIAAAMFNSREAHFNSSIAKKLLCDTGCDIFLPQRDGLDFTSLAESLSKEMPPEEVIPAVKNLIYSQNLGYFLPLSDIVIANLDEPSDGGVIVEMCYGRRMGKGIIGLRTDIRSPYGGLEDASCGVHAFSAYQCDILINHISSTKAIENGDQDLETIAQKLRKAIVALKPQIKGELPDSALSDPDISYLISNAKILFEGIEAFNIRNSQSIISERYLNNRAKLEKYLDYRIELEKAVSQMKL